MAVTFISKEDTEVVNAELFESNKTIYRLDPDKRKAYGALNMSSVWRYLCRPRLIISQSTQINTFAHSVKMRRTSSRLKMDSV
jgi:hypothetical protein